MKKIHSNNRRRPIEIYFVLYLAALIFLIPKNGEESNKSADVSISTMELPFSIRPEKSVLFCRLSLDSNLINILHIDSVNTIFHTGDVDDISYEFIIEDQVFKQRVRLAANLEQNNRFFKVNENPRDNSATFQWLPPTDDRMNKSYIVHVIANAKTKGDAQPITARTQFTLVVSYFNRETGLPTSIEEIPLIADEMPQTLILPTEPNLTDFSLSLRQDVVNTVAYQDWENDIFILGGLNPINDLLKNPDIIVKHNPENNGGSVFISNYFSNGITLRGKSPGFGSMNVNITLKRRYDNKSASISFNVVPQSIGNPEYPQVMYPGLSYTIKPNLPFISGMETQALLKEGERLRATSTGSDEITFSPQISDTGKVLTLERYINNSLIGQKHRISIKSFPPPTIVKISKIANNLVLVQTNSFGYFNNRDNIVAKLTLTGNATFSKERFGQMRVDRTNHTWTQFFEIVPKDNSKPFIFKVSAVDRRGETSDWLDYEIQ